MLKEFAVKGNVLDLAIGIIIGGAFGKIVSSFVAHSARVRSRKKIRKRGSVNFTG